MRVMVLLLDHQALITNYRRAACCVLRKLAKLENKDWFHTPSENWGWPRFVSLSELDEPETGFLVNGGCMVEAEVAVLGISNPL
ncbi:hypothetical protein CUMW_179980 [Citrus unshiu]|uniref:MATH domain-containing protein n=1 Tax=Citrus unshiu TaxID=55188 RepID=A0A2H5PYQ2_CITUN|nr:hypothetical protein CUMW_179980 [Citrus unshiu]